MNRLWRACLLAAAAALPLAAHAQPADPAMTVLLGQAAFWRAHGRPEQAAAALRRALELDPANPDALVQQAQDAAGRGDEAAAHAALLQLKASHSADPRVPLLEQSLGGAAPDPAALAQARALALSGKADAAVAAYRRLFNGAAPPAALATEYYQTLCGTENGQAAAIAGLAAFLRANPNDGRAQLAFALVLTLRDPTRAAGLERLAKLTHVPELTGPAQDAWRDALLWSGNNPPKLGQIDAYLERFPGDTDMVRARASLAAAAPGAIRYAANQAPGVATDTSPPHAAVPSEPVPPAGERVAQAAPNRALDRLINPPAATVPPGARAVTTLQDGAPSPAPADPDLLPTLQGEVRAKPPPDAITAEIDRRLDEGSTDVSTAPELEAGASLALRGRSGPSGLASLYELTAPLDASYTLAGYGRLNLAVTPDDLQAGGASANDLRFFGTNPLAPGTSLRHARSGAAGVALSLGYSYGDARADIGSTPLGFEQSNLVGGIELAPHLTDALTLRATLDRRAVTDSLLSYAGQTDGRTGMSWGGVTRDHGHAQLEGTAGGASYYAGAGGGLLTGQHVRDNTEADAGAGFSLPVWGASGEEVRTGLDLSFLSYHRNLQSFTFGSGGYFSPQYLAAGLIPITYRRTITPDLSVSIGGAVGVQSFKEKSTPVFPLAGLQQSSQALAAAQPGTATTLPGTQSTGVAGGAHAEIDYRALEQLHVGAKAGFDRLGNFTEGTGEVYARYVFGGGW